MKKLAFGSVLTLLLAAQAFAQDIAVTPDVQVVQFGQLQQELLKRDGKLRVVNFWATWCKPCVKELPHFVKLQKAYKDRGVEVLFVSLDAVEQLESRVQPFLAKKGLFKGQYLLDEVDFNAWIDKVNPMWQGDIPATLLIDQRDGVRVFLTQEFDSYESLKAQVDKALAGQ